MITARQLVTIMPLAMSRVEAWVEPLNQAMTEFGIDNSRRLAAFLAQIAHESGQLRYVRELASGVAYDTGRLAERLGNTPEADGDGQKYKGRGLIQITGKYNYRDCSVALYGDADILIARPELLEDKIPAARSAAWYWWSHGLNVVADCPNSFQTITKLINGGLNGYAERLHYYETALRVIK